MTEQLRPENRGIRLVEAGAVPPMVQKLSGELFFAVEKHPYETQDLFLTIKLTGVRRESSIWLIPLDGLTVIDNAVVVDGFQSMLSKHKDFFHIGVEAEPGFVWPGKLLRCDMHIGGFETYYTSMMDTMDPGEEGSWSCADIWQSSDPDDPNEYALMASPSDTALLSRLSFSFHVVSAHDNDVMIR